MKILIIKHGAFGDVVRTSYFIEPLKRKFPFAEIFWLTSIHSMDLLRFNPFITKIAYTVESITKYVFDWVISLDDEYEIIKKISYIDYRKLTGAFIDEKNNIIYSEDSAIWFDMGLLSKYGKHVADKLKKLNKLGHAVIFSNILNIINIKPIFYNSPIIEASIIDDFDVTFFNIGLNSGAGGRWKSKELSIKETEILVEKLLEVRIENRSTFIYLLGGEQEMSRNSYLLSKFNDENIRIVDTRDSLLKFAAIIKNCDYLVTTDSLALHLAIAQKIPNLSFYAPTSAAEIDTFGTGVKITSTSPDYCNYSIDCDNNTITAERIFDLFYNHVIALANVAS